jgi:diguanylate cyclase (GGDEF)-like protein/PAS domain S-box-containing protein
MRLRIKTLLFVMVSTIGLIALLYLISNNFLFSGFRQVEDQETIQNVNRATDALSGQLAYLKAKASDWSNWDDTYAFMEDGNREFVKSNLMDETFENLHINLILFLRNSGDVVEGEAYNLEENRQEQIPNAFTHLTPSDPLLLLADKQDSREGLLVLPEGPILVATAPILTSQMQGPSRGTLVMGQYLNQSLVSQLGETVHVTLSVSGVDDKDLSPDMQWARDQLHELGQTITGPIDEQTIAGYSLLKDFYGHPAFLVRVETPRPVYAQGKTTMGYIFSALLALGLVCAIGAYVLLGRLLHASEALRTSEERYSLAVRASNDGLWDWNLETGEVYYSARWKALIGYEPEDISARPDEWLNRIHPNDRLRVEAEIANHLKGLTPALHSEHRMKQRDGRDIWILCRGLAVRAPDGRAVRMAGSLGDITVRKQAEEQLLHDAFHDSLTGLANRALFMDRLGRALERAKRSLNYSFAVMYLDLDRFKIVNDTYGHPVGDQLLIVCANRIQLSVRSSDTVARLSGDEFIVLVEDVGALRDATNLAGCILGELALPFDIGGRQIFTSASVGIAMGNINFETPEQVIQDVDIALYRAKANGRAQYLVFDPMMRGTVRATLELENDIRAAVERHEFNLDYQPIISLADGRIIGFEALARWQHPRRGFVAPSEFIPIAEECGLIIPLGDWVLREACRQLREWKNRFPSAPPFAINVNVSAKQFAQRDLPTQVTQILAEYELDAESLHLEITESTIMQDAAAAAAMLTRFRELGIQVQIDDFGTGYSSLSYLHQFPVDTLKIDRSFIRHMEQQGNGRGKGSELVRTIVSLAHQLGMKVVAEGVETADQLAGLKALDCQFGQGYLMSKPLPSTAIPDLIASSGLVWSTLEDKARLTV